MMRLDRVGALRAAGLDRVGVDRALPEQVPLDAQPPGLALEHLDERLADDLTLPFRLDDPFERAQERLTCIHEVQVPIEAEPRERRQHLAAFVLAHQAVVHVQQVQPVGAECQAEQLRRDGGVHPA